MNDAAHEIKASLGATPASLSPKFFYDAAGSALFEKITQLPEYYPTRTEAALMQMHAPELRASIGPGVTLIEFGAGNCTKASTLCTLLEPVQFVGVDISGDFLVQSVKALQARHPRLDMHAVHADISHAVALPSAVHSARRLVFYPGSSIGNFDPDAALQLLQRMRNCVGGDGGLLIGFDLPKDPALLEAAYNDAQGVTAAFNLNILTHVNALIGSNFDLREWKHHAYFNAAESRIEMHLQAQTPTRVLWPGGERIFAKGETIHTENSYKYSAARFTALLGQAGFPTARLWTDDQAWFAVAHAQP